MNVGPFVVTDSKATKLMKQRDALLDDITQFAKPASVLRATPGDDGNDPALPQRFPVRLGIVPAIREKRLGLLERATGLSADGRNRIHERQQLRDVMSVGTGEGDGQRRSVGVRQQMMLGAVFAAIYGAGASFFPPCTARECPASTITREKSILSSLRSSASKCR